MSSADAILIVDDIAANRALALATLEDAGYAVVEAASGPEALAAFERAPAACVLMDVRMPGMDGFEVCERLRALPGGKDVPVLFVTALRDLDTFDQAMLAGAFDFLTKPVRPNELLARVRAALALRQASVERDDLAADLKRQRDDLTRALLMNERLTAFVVHDLKNPVSGMRLAAEIIGRDKAASPRVQELARAIHGEADRVLRMILGLLDLSRATEGQLVITRAPVDVAALVASVADEARVRAETRAVTLACDAVAATFALDASLFLRVLANLIDNALAHAPERSQVEVEARLDPADDNLVVIVRDHGPGVPPELRARIFDRFVRGEGSGRSQSLGHGLGLAFCKAAVEAHGGTISVEDAAPGARFVTRWPSVAATRASDDGGAHGP